MSRFATHGLAYGGDGGKIGQEGKPSSCLTYVRVSRECIESLFVDHVTVMAV